MASRLLDAAKSSGTEAKFLEVLRSEVDLGYLKDELDYRDGKGNTVLIALAIYHDWPAAATAVIKHGFDVNATNKDGESALHCAGRRNRRETAHVLLEQGADRAILSKQGHSAVGHTDCQSHQAGPARIRVISKNLVREKKHREDPNLLFHTGEYVDCDLFLSESRPIPMQDMFS